MRVLLDECVDRRLARERTGHGVSDLLALAQSKLDAFVTTDRNLAFSATFAEVLYRRLATLPNARPGEVTWVEI